MDETSRSLKWLLAAASAAVLSACGVTGYSSVEPAAAASPWAGSVCILEGRDLPTGIKRRAIGTLEATQQVGYGSTDGLMPTLANEARKVGANAIVNVWSGHRPSAFSWARPMANGEGVRVEGRFDCAAHGGRLW